MTALHTRTEYWITSFSHFLGLLRPFLGAVGTRSMISVFPYLVLLRYALAELPINSCAGTHVATSGRSARHTPRTTRIAL